MSVKIDLTNAPTEIRFNVEKDAQYHAMQSNGELITNIGLKSIIEELTKAVSASIIAIAAYSEYLQRNELKPLISAVSRDSARQQITKARSHFPEHQATAIADANLILAQLENDSLLSRSHSSNPYNLLRVVTGDIVEKSIDLVVHCKTPQIQFEYLLHILYSEMPKIEKNKLN